MRVVFMGTPDIAATCLKKIIADGFDVVGVYTQPDRPKGRGMKMVFPPVKDVAIANDIPVFQPENFRDDETYEQLKALQPDVVAVVAYGRILPQRVLDIVPNGFINIHASVLPQYRGSAPYQWAVLDGLKETGVSAQFMVHAMDAGDGSSDSIRLVCSQRRKTSYHQWFSLELQCSLGAIERIYQRIYLNYAL